MRVLYIYSTSINQIIEITFTRRSYTLKGFNGAVVGLLPREVTHAMGVSFQTYKSSDTQYGITGNIIAKQNDEVEKTNLNKRFWTKLTTQLMLPQVSRYV